MKKLTALLLVLAMSLSLVACSAGATAPTAASEEKVVEEKKEEVKEAAPVEEAADESWKEEHPGWLCKDKTTFTVYTWEGESSSYLPPSNDLFFWKWMEDYTNVHIEWEVAPYADFDTLIAAKLASGEKLNDIVMMGKQQQTTLSAGQNGMLVDLAPHWNDWFSKVETYFNNIDVNFKGIITNSDNTIYAVPGFAAPQQNRIILLFNTLWMDKLGLKIPETVEEFEAVLRAMKEAGDLNGNGLDDEVIFTATDVEWLLPSIGTAFGVETIESADFYAAGADGVVYPEYTTENMKAMLGWLNGLYEEGLLDPEITTNTMDIVAEKVTADRVGVVSMYSSFAGSYGNLTSAGQADPGKEYYSIGKPLTSKWNSTPTMTMYNNYSRYAGIASTCENPELAARWLDTLIADPEALIIRACGEPGNTFEFDANHNPVYKPAPEGQAWSINPLGCGQIPMPHIQTDLQLNFSKSYDQAWYVDSYTANQVEYATWKMASVPKLGGYSEEETELRNLYQADLKAGWQEYRNKFITGELDTEADWDAYAKTLSALGMDELTRCYQSVYNRTH